MERMSEQKSDILKELKQKLCLRFNFLDIFEWYSSGTSNCSDPPSSSIQIFSLFQSNLIIYKTILPLLFFVVFGNLQTLSDAFYPCVIVQTFQHIFLCPKSLKWTNYPFSDWTITILNLNIIGNVVVPAHSDSCVCLDFLCIEHLLTHTSALAVSCSSTNKGHEIWPSPYRTSSLLYLATQVTLDQYRHSSSSPPIPLTTNISYSLSSISSFPINSWPYVTLDLLTRERLLYPVSLRKITSFVREFQRLIWSDPKITNSNKTFHIWGSFLEH